MLEKLGRRDTKRQINISSVNIKGNCVVTPQTILWRPLNLPETFFYTMWFTFWKYKQMHPNESQSSFISQDFYFHLPTSEYERDFSLFNFFFGILKQFPKGFIILKYILENHFSLFTKWFLLTTYPKYLLKTHSIMVSRVLKHWWFQKNYIKYHHGKVERTLNQEPRDPGSTLGQPLRGFTSVLCDCCSA